MATNRIFERGRQFEADVSGVNGSGTSDAVQSGDPGAIGSLPFVALTDEDADGMATIQTDGVFELSVRGHDGTANAAVDAGEIVYWDNTTGELDVATAGIRFGYALEAVASGATTTVRVKIGY